ncbi:MAG TPA: tetratricopeptide repeat protein [Candidatus Eisenbacteria bacterium]|jgi:tetratricopeptide (TPR) repeat protein
MLLLATAIWIGSAIPASGPETPYPSEEALRRYAQGRLFEEQGAGPEALREYYRAMLIDDRSAGIARRVSEVTATLGDAERSLEFAERALAIDPHDARAHWLKGSALLNLGRDSESVAPLESAAREDTTELEFLRTLARAAERLDRVALAARCYRRIVWVEEDDGEAWFQLGAAEARSNRFSSADSAMAKAVELNPLRPGRFFLEGWIAENLGRLPAAAELYRRHLSVHVHDQAARRRLIVVLSRQKLHREAFQEARTLARARPDDLEVLEVEAQLAFDSGAASQGLKLLDDLKRLRPDDPEARTVRLTVLARAGRGKQATAEAEADVARQPDDLEARLRAAHIEELCHRTGRAIEHLRRAAEIAPDSLAPRVQLARTYQADDRLAEAERVWSEAAAHFPTVNGLAFDLAVCREKLGDLPGAEYAVRDVLAREPDNPSALNFLGYLFADHARNLDEALGLIRRALAFDPDNGAYLDSLGWAYYRLGRLEEARSYLERAVSLTGGDPIVREHLGDVYKDLRLNDLARDQYRQSLSNDSSNPRLKAKLSELR